MLNLVYWDGKMPQSTSTLISMSLLAGTMVGQVVLGVLGDRYGRRKVYGIELMILTVATVLMCLASKGALQSTNRVAWIASWRFVMGVGIGGDYPLSAVITAEYADSSVMCFLTRPGSLPANIEALCSRRCFTCRRSVRLLPMSLQWL
jgi:MFS transporter, PHS family, inorganic phosphate transporter